MDLPVVSSAKVASCIGAGAGKKSSKKGKMETRKRGEARSQEPPSHEATDRHEPGRADARGPALTSA
jgi:hypothetical protein